MDSKFILFLLISYFIGSIPSGVIIGKKFKGIDIREHGSKNTGATNAYRVLGKTYGISVFLLDTLKGFLPVYVASILGIMGWQLIIIGLIAILGHTLSLFLKFKGGKGVATSLGVFLFLIPHIVTILLLFFILIVIFTKYISLASIIVAGLFPILVLLMPVKPELGKLSIFIFSIVVALFVIYKHKKNIKRLLNGTESKFGNKK